MIKFIILISAVMFLGGDLPHQPSRFEDENLPRILFIGDQITRGINDPSGFGFRDHVQNLLGPGLWNFVGPYTDPATHRVLDVDHAGDNWNDTSLARKQIKQLLWNFMDPEAKKDWVLIHLGTVDIMTNNSIEKYQVGVQGMKKVYRNAYRERVALMKKLNQMNAPPDPWFRAMPKWKRKKILQHIAKQERRRLAMDITEVERKKEMTVDEIKEDIKGLIDDIIAYNPHIKIGLAKIIPCRARGFNEKIMELNLWIEEMIKRKRELELKNNLFLVDMYEAFTKTPNWGEELMSSRWYPNKKGYELMANELAKVIKKGSTKVEQGTTSISLSTTITLGSDPKVMHQLIQSEVFSSPNDR